MEVVVTFLAMLELVKVRAIRIFQEEMAGPIMIEAAAGMEEAAENAVLTKPRKSNMEREEIKSILESLVVRRRRPATLSSVSARSWKASS